MYQRDVLYTRYKKYQGCEGVELVVQGKDLTSHDEQF